jgi:large subunit ribosomal protein L23
MDSHDVIIRPLHTEKSVEDIQGADTYHFEVNGKANKHQIREAVEELFPGRKVESVRTLWVKGKRKRVRYNVVQTPRWKKAMVRLREGDTIDIGY